MAAAVGVAGCGGSHSQTTVTNRLVPPEQELRDLERARDVGAISPSEYEQQRQKILAGR